MTKCGMGNKHMAKTAHLVAFDNSIIGDVIVPDEIDGFPAIIIQGSHFFTLDMRAVNSATDATYLEATAASAID